MAEGEPIVQRPRLRLANAADATAVGAFLTGLSSLSRRFRFHGACSSASPGLLNLLSNVDGLRHQAWLAWVGEADNARVIGEARFVMPSQGCDAELAIAVADEWQGSGLADTMLDTLLRAAASAGVHDLYGDVMESNARMLAFLRRHSFTTIGVARSVIRMRRDPRYPIQTPHL